MRICLLLKNNNNKNQRFSKWEQLKNKTSRAFL
nr:MAG TPA: hypothetical protein [Caudoviricetes sp.]